MPQVIGVIAGIVAAVAGSVAIVIATVATVIATVIGGIVGVLGPIITGILGPLTTAIQFITSPVKRIVDIVTAPLMPTINLLNETIISPVLTIKAALDGAILDVAGSINVSTAPILTPLKDTLSSINMFVGESDTWVKGELGPARTLADTVRSISYLRMTRQLLDGTSSVAGTLDAVASRAGVPVAGSIATLWNSTVKTSLGIFTTVEDHFQLLSGEISGVETRLTKEQEQALTIVRSDVDKSIEGVRSELAGETATTSRKVAAVERRIEDLPWFLSMLDRAFG